MIRNLVRCTCALLVASFALAHAAFAEEEEGEDDASEFVRTGFYLGVGGSSAFPSNWDDDYDNDLDEDATDLSNANSQHALNQQLPPDDEIVPLNVRVFNSDLEDALLGVNGVIGYRAAAVVAFEAELEWLLDSNKTNLDVFTRTDTGPDDFIGMSSSGSHTIKVEELWTLTANVKLYAPLEALTGRVQPFAKFGLGFQNSELKTRIATSGLTTTSKNGSVVVPADFQSGEMGAILDPGAEITENKDKFDGAIRVGGGFDIYATRNIAAEFNFAYVVPFSDIGSLRTDYWGLQWRLIYRF